MRFIASYNNSVNKFREEKDIITVENAHFKLIEDNTFHLVDQLIRK